MKKIITVILILTILASLALTSCDNIGKKGDRLSVVCTVFPLYDWTRRLLGDRLSEVDLTLLLDKGVDLHSFQPGFSDIVKISTCDVFVYVGGESDAWVSDALKEATNKDMIVINLMQVLGDKAKIEEVKEGMEGEHEEGEEDEGEEPEYDEHIWLSLKNAVICCEYISSKLCEADSENADIYTSCRDSYKAKLTELDGKYTQAVANSKFKTAIIADRFPLRYLFDDYGLDYFAAFVGCSAETEASFETVIFLAGKIDSLGVTHVLTIEGSDQRIAQTVISNAETKSVQILKINSLQSVTSADVNNGVTYLKIMEDNLTALTAALN